MIFKSCVKLVAGLSNIFLYPSWNFMILNITLVLFTEVGVLLCVKRFPIVLSVLKNKFKSQF